ncbi:hypothetical protein K490DRAFT_55151 [Saccharata proteae CBS 121410]|uniref:DUF1275 domain protein n=1 Tax=Saccharata proteae CBS 121410 TaxID=1314787 RepID=A0A6A5YCX2_9PEZI|nr:hypothetical protein K490DRAFT_55151 [Saccharata proteae CBS 121410]
MHSLSLTPLSSNVNNAPTLSNAPTLRDVELNNLSEKREEEKPQYPSPSFLEAQPDRTNTDPDHELLRLPPSRRWQAYLMQDMHPSTMLECELYALSFTTGMMDAMTFNFYGVFCSKQTGNLINFALAALDPQSVLQTEANIGVSFSCFIAGSALFGHFGNFVGKKRRGWLIFMNTFQALLLIAATCIRQFTSPHGLQDSGADPSALAVIALIAIASGGQIALALTVGMPEINTTMVTGALVMLSQDKDIHKLRNKGRDRKLFFVISILLGAFVGATSNRYASGSLTLLLVVIVKAIMTFCFMFNKGTKELELGPGKPHVTESSVSLRHILWAD